MSLVTSAFLTCTLHPTTMTTTATATVTTTFTETYKYTAIAACPTSEWTVTYTIIEVCTGDPDVWTPPTVPPNFVQTTVVCDVCATPTQTITCPVPEAERTGSAIIIAPTDGVTAGPAPVHTGMTMPEGTSTGMAMPEGTGMPGGHGSGPVVTAGAPRASSLKKGLAVLAGVALIAGQIVM